MTQGKMGSNGTRRVKWNSIGGPSKRRKTERQLTLRTSEGIVYKTTAAELTYTLTKRTYTEFLYNKATMLLIHIPQNNK